MDALWWFLAIYTAISVSWAIAHVGYKHSKEPWYEAPIWWPALCLACLIGCVTFVQDLFDSWTWNRLYWKRRAYLVSRQHMRKSFVVDGYTVIPDRGIRKRQLDCCQGFVVVKRDVDFKDKPSGCYFRFTLTLSDDGSAESSVIRIAASGNDADCTNSAK